MGRSDENNLSQNVVVNGRFLSRRVTGVERYATEILRCLGNRVQIVKPGRDIQGIAGHTWEQLILPNRIPSRSILWSPANTGPLAVSNQVLTLCDLSPLEHPEWFKPAFAMCYRLFLPLLVRRVRRVVTLSEHIRQKMIARFALPNDQVTVIPGGVDKTKFHPLKRPANIGRYILFVGSLEPRKNLSTLLMAWKQIEKKYPDVSLTIVGGEGRVFRHKFLEVAERVKFSGYVPESDLPALYSGAAVFILPSFDEGFGLPVLEAMACGTPVVASTGGALPEVVGDAGILFNPNDPPALAMALDLCLSDPNLLNSLREMGQEHVKQFSWSVAAEKIWQVLRDDYAN